MIAYCVVMAGCILTAFNLLTLEKNFLWHLSGLFAIFGGATALTVLHASSGARRHIAENLRRAVTFFWAWLCYPLVLGLLVSMVWSWYYIYTDWSGYFIVQIFGLGGTGIVGAFSIAWVLSGPRSEPPPRPSALALHTERKGMLGRLQS